MHKGKKSAKFYEAMERYRGAKAESKPGEGGRFKALKGALAAKGAKSPGGLAAWIGRRKYGKAGFQKMAAGGK